MPFPAQVFRVFIASPSDVKVERDIADKVIQDWNNLNSNDRQLVLLPLRWETHSSPEYGQRPQEIINRQIVDQCDILIGVFWTKIGSQTGISESGTIEEIERVANLDKPVMLYFSRDKANPDDIDLEQLARLREFKQKIFKNALVEHYSDTIEFKEKLSRQLDVAIKKSIATDTSGAIDTSLLTTTTDIQLEFANSSDGNSIGTRISVETRLFDLMDFDKIEDYLGPSESPGPDVLGVTTGFLGQLSVNITPVNKDYTRQTITSHIIQNFFTPVCLSFINRGSVGARDVFVDILVTDKASNIVVVGKKDMPVGKPSKSLPGVWSTVNKHPIRPDEILIPINETWTTQIDIRALQPQRTIILDPVFYIGSMIDCEVTIRAIIYADTLSKPLTQNLTISFKVNKNTVSLADIHSTPAE